jgi:chromosome segregation ATPase
MDPNNQRDLFIFSIFILFCIIGCLLLILYSDDKIIKYVSSSIVCILGIGIFKITYMLLNCINSKKKCIDVKNEKNEILGGVITDIKNYIDMDEKTLKEEIDKLIQENKAKKIQLNKSLNGYKTTIKTNFEEILNKINCSKPKWTMNDIFNEVNKQYNCKSKPRPKIELKQEFYDDEKLYKKLFKDTVFINEIEKLGKMGESVTLFDSYWKFKKLYDKIDILTIDDIDPNDTMKMMFKIYIENKDRIKDLNELLENINCMPFFKQIILQFQDKMTELKEQIKLYQEMETQLAEYKLKEESYERIKKELYDQKEELREKNKTLTTKVFENNKEKERLESEIKTLNNEKESISKKIEESQQKTLVKENEIKQYLSEIREKDDSILTLKAQIKSLDDTNKVLKQQIENHVETIGKRDKEIEELKELIKQLEDKIRKYSEKESVFNEQKRYVDEQQLKLFDADDSLNNKNKKITLDIIALRKEFEAKSIEFTKKEKELNDKIEYLELNDNTENLKERNAQNQELRDEIAILKQQILELKEIIRKITEEKENINKQLLQEYSKVDVKIDELYKELAEIAQRKKKLKNSEAVKDIDFDNYEYDVNAIDIIKNTKRDLVLLENRKEALTMTINTLKKYNPNYYEIGDDIERDNIIKKIINENIELYQDKANNKRKLERIAENLERIKFLESKNKELEEYLINYKKSIQERIDESIGKNKILEVENEKLKIQVKKNEDEKKQYEDEKKKYEDEKKKYEDEKDKYESQINLLEISKKANLENFVKLFNQTLTKLILKIDNSSKDLINKIKEDAKNNDGKPSDENKKNKEYIKILISKVEELIEKNKTFQPKLDEAKAEIESLNEQLKLSIDKIQELDNKVKTCESNIDKKNKEFIELNESKSELERLNITLKGSIANLEDTIKQKDALFSKDFTDIEQKLNKDIERLNSENELLKKSIIEIQTKISILESSNAELTKSKISLESSNAELTKSKISLESSNAELTKSKISLESSNAELEKSNDQLKINISKLEKLNKELEELHKQKDKLISDECAKRRLQLQKDIEDLNRIIEESKQNIERIQKENIESKENILKLNRIIEELNQNIEIIQKENTDLKKSIERLEKEKTELQKTIKERDQTFSTPSDLNKSIKEMNDKLQANIKELDLKIAEKNTLNEKLDKENKGLSKKLEESIKENVELNRKITEIQLKLDRYIDENKENISEKTSFIGSLTVFATKLFSSMFSTSNDIDPKVKELEDKKDISEKFNLIYDIHRNFIYLKNKEIDELNKRVLSLETENIASKLVSDVEISSLNDKIKLLESKLVSDEEISLLKNKLKTLELKLEDYKTKYEESEKNLGLCKEQILKKDEDIVIINKRNEELLNQIKKINSESERIIEEKIKPLKEKYEKDLAIFTDKNYTVGTALENRDAAIKERDAAISKLSLVEREHQISLEGIELNIKGYKSELEKNSKEIDKLKKEIQINSERLLKIKDYLTEVKEKTILPSIYQTINKILNDNYPNIIDQMIDLNKEIVKQLILNKRILDSNKEEIEKNKQDFDIIKKEKEIIEKQLKSESEKLKKELSEKIITEREFNIKYKTLEDQFLRLRSDNEILKSNIEDYIKKIKTKDDEIANLKQQIKIEKESSIMKSSDLESKSLQITSKYTQDLETLEKEKQKIKEESEQLQSELSKELESSKNLLIDESIISKENTDKLILKIKNLVRIQTRFAFINGVLKSNITKLNTKNTELIKNYAKLEILLAQSKYESEQVQKDLAQSRSESEQVKKDLTQSKSESEQVKKDLAQSKSESEQVKKDLAQSRSESEQVQKDLAQSRSESEQVKKDLTQTRSESEQVKKDLVQIRSESEQVKKDLAQSRSESEQVKKDLAQSRSESEQVKKDLVQTRSEYQLNQTTLRTISEELKKIKIELEKERFENKELITINESLIAKIIELEKSMAALTLGNTKLQDSLTLLDSKFITLQKKLQELDETKSNNDSKNTLLIKSLKDKLLELEKSKNLIEKNLSLKIDKLEKDKIDLEERIRRNNIKALESSKLSKQYEDITLLYDKQLIEFGKMRDKISKYDIDIMNYEKKLNLCSIKLNTCSTDLKTCNDELEIYKEKYESFVIQKDLLDENKRLKEEILELKSRSNFNNEISGDDIIILDSSLLSKNTKQNTKSKIIVDNDAYSQFLKKNKRV